MTACCGEGMGETFKDRTGVPTQNRETPLAGTSGHPEPMGFPEKRRGTLEATFGSWAEG